MTLRLNGRTSGYTEIDAPAVAGSNTLVLPTGAGNAYQVIRNGATAGSLEFTDKIVSGTAQNSTSGTSIDFTGIPSWVKRVTVMFNGVSTNGSSIPLIQLGDSGGIETTGYSGQGDSSTTSGGASSVFTSTPNTVGFNLSSTITTLASTALRGMAVLTNVSGNTWVFWSYNSQATGASGAGTGTKETSAILDRVRITTVNGTDTFDAGSINILYE